MFCASRLVFGGIEGIGSFFQVLRAQTHFRRYRVRRVHFSCFARPNLFSTIPRASVPVFMFCAPRLIFGGTEGVGSSFHVLRCRTRFRRHSGRRVPFSCFACPDSFLAVPRASSPVLMSYALGLVFSGAEYVGSRFQLLRARTHFWRYRGRRVSFSCFVLPDSFLAVPRAPGPVFMLCAPALVFGGTEGFGSRFHDLHARTHFWLYRGRPIPFSCFAPPNSFSAVPRASDPFFIF
jgi:hypothetical protein